jgi:spermidine synthase
MRHTSAQQSRRSPVSVAALYSFALFSGMAALVYEVAWTKMLTLTFGRTTLAASAVIGGFMGGMGIGAWLYHRLQGGRLDAIRLYAGLEIGIAVTTALLTSVFAGLPGFFTAVASEIPAGPATNLFRILFVLMILLVPAALMGATYPALCTVLIRSRDGLERHLGPIYGLNTVGAAIGALGAGFVLIEQLGLRDSVWVANCLNLAIAAGAWMLGRVTAPEASDLATLDDEEAAIPTELPRWISGTVLFGSGFATLAYEIVWFRALRYLFGNNTYALTTMLAVFLLGLGIGGLLCGRARQRSFPERSLALSQLGIAILAVAAIGAECAVLSDRQLQSSVSIFLGDLVDYPWWHRLLIDLGVALAMMLPATLLMGFSFPLASRLFLGDVRRIGQRVGAAYLLANLGSILGAVGAALVLLPQFGTIGGTRAIAVINLSLGALVLIWLPWSGRLRLAWGMGTAVVVFSTLLLLPTRLPFRPAENIAGNAMELLFEEEGDLATVQVWGGREHPERRAITVDGIPIGETQGLRRPIYAKQILLAHLPMVLDPEIRRTLNIGLGSGSTLHALASHPTVEVLGAVEISGAVVRGSLLFEESEVLSDPRTHLQVEDVAHFLLRNPGPYDLIISDGKLAQDFSGNALMLCHDFYEHASQRLSREGMLVQWLPLGIPHGIFKQLLRTFLESFPEAELFFEDPAGVLLVGSRSPIAGRNAENLATEQARRQLEGLSIPGVEALLSRWVASGPQLRHVVGEGRISTWDHSTMEYALYRVTYRQVMQARGPNLKLLLAAGGLAEGSPFLPADSRYLVSTDLLRRARLHQFQGRIKEAVRLAKRALDAHPENPQAASVLEQIRTAADSRSGISVW